MEVADKAKLPIDEVMAIRDLTRVTTSLDAPVTADGTLRVPIQASYPLAQADQAIKALRFDVRPGVPHETYGGVVSLDGRWSID